jgi:hypothetical protein
VPLNLLGGPGDVPDFVVSAQVFSYVFTLRGDKLWKQPPATSGAVKVSLLAEKVYAALVENNALTAAELASELGREVTETAIVRALVELWAQLRVIPMLQQDGAGAKGSGTMWELTSRRFTKAMKAGGNAGQPTALSALTSLYLAQVFAATEEEIETFLSPLTARSRVRDVLHGLTGARQLETVAVGGKTMLYIPGALPEFPAVAVEEGTVEGVEAAAVERPKKVGTGRIRSFAGERKAASEFRGKPARSTADRRTGGRATKPASRFGARADGKSDRERRPFRREGAGAKPSFSKPWDEDRKARPARAAAAGAPDAFKKFRKPAAGERKPLGDREQAGLPPEERVFSKPKFERESKARDLAKRPYKAREDGVERGAFKPRSFSGAGGGKDRGSKPGGFGGKRPYTPRSAEGGERSFSKPRFDRGSKPGGFGGKRPYKPRDSEGGERTFTKRPYTPRASEGGERSFSKPRFDRGSKPGGFGAKRPYTPRAAEGGERTFAKRPYKPREAEGGERGAGSVAKRPYKPRSEGGFERGGAGPAKKFGAKTFGAKPAGRFGGKPGAKFGGKPGAKFGGKPGNKFGAKKFGAKPGGFGAKRGGPAGKTKPGARKPEAEE